MGVEGVMITLGKPRGGPSDMVGDLWWLFENGDRVATRKCGGKRDLAGGTIVLLFKVC